MKKLLVAFVAIVAISFASCVSNTTKVTVEEDSTACTKTTNPCACDSCAGCDDPCACDTAKVDTLAE